MNQDDKDYIFVYGIFRDVGRVMLKEAIFCGKSTVEGSIYKVNEFYPGFVRMGNKEVIGDVYLVPKSLLYLLDEYEGDEYDRNRIRTSTDIECWIYEYKYDISKFKKIECGDWLLR